MKKFVTSFVAAVITAAAVGSGAPAAFADGTPTNTVIRATKRHFRPQPTSVSEIRCTRPSSTIADCKSKARVTKASGKVEIYRVFITVTIPIDDGQTTWKVTRTKRIG